MNEISTIDTDICTINSEISTTTEKIRQQVESLDSLSQPNPIQDEIASSVRGAFQVLEIDNKEKALQELAKWAEGRAETYNGYDDTFMRRIQTFQRIIDDKTTDQFQDLAGRADRWDRILQQATANLEMFHMNFDRFWSKMPRSTDNDNGPFSPAASKLADQDLSGAPSLLAKGTKHPSNYIEKKRLMKLREQHYIAIIGQMQKFINDFRDQMSQIQDKENAAKKALSELLDEHKGLEKQRAAQEMILANYEKKEEERKKTLESRTIETVADQVYIEQVEIPREEKKEEVEEKEETDKPTKMKSRAPDSARSSFRRPIVILGLARNCSVAIGEDGKQEIDTENVLLEEDFIGKLGDSSLAGTTNAEAVAEEKTAKNGEENSSSQNGNIENHKFVSKIEKSVVFDSPPSSFPSSAQGASPSDVGESGEKPKKKKKHTGGPHGYTAVMGNNIEDPNDKFKKLLEEGGASEGSYEYEEDEEGGGQATAGENGEPSTKNRTKTRKVRREAIQTGDKETQTEISFETLSAHFFNQESGVPGQNGQFVQQYDQNGKPIYNQNQQFDANGRPIYNQNQMFDANGQPINPKAMQQNGQFMQNGQFVQQLDANGNPINNQNQQFDANGRPIYNQNQQFDANGNPIYNQNQQFDANGNPIFNQNQNQQFDANGNPIYNQNQQFDANGNPIIFT